MAARSTASHPLGAFAIATAVLGAPVATLELAAELGCERAGAGPREGTCPPPMPLIKSLLRLAETQVTT